MAELLFGLDLVKQAKIRLGASKALPLHQAREAHRLMGRAEVVGKLALRPWALWYRDAMGCNARSLIC